MKGQSCSLLKVNGVRYWLEYRPLDQIWRLTHTSTRQYDDFTSRERAIDALALGELPNINGSDSTGMHTPHVSDPARLYYSDGYTYGMRSIGGGLYE